MLNLIKKIKKGDKVKIIKGKDKGKEGAVEKVLNEKRKIIIEGLNLFKKTIRAKREGKKGQIVSVASPLSASNVMVICPKCGKPARVGFKIVGDGKVRLCKLCKSEF